MNAHEQQTVLDRWLNDHAGLIFKVVRAYTTTAVDRDDLFQDIAVELWRSLQNFRGESSETTWIYRVALRTALSWSAKERTRRRVNRPLSEEPYVCVKQQVTTDPRLEWLYAEIQKLQPIDRSVALLLLDSVPYAEMAQLLGITESHVGVKVHRIKKRLTEAANRLTASTTEASHGV